MIKDKLKNIWKSIMRPLLRVYVLNPKLYICNRLLTDNNEKHYSQFGQDLFVFKEVFNGKREGIFVDVGGNHPINANNTYLLEQNGWHGIAIEPQEKLRDLWPLLRKTKCLGCVAGPESKEVVFIEGKSDEDGLCGVEGFNKCSQVLKKTAVRQKRLDDILKENNIQNVDYLSVDVEGYELNVLKSIDFSKINITLIGFENDQGFKWLPFLGKKLGSEFGDNKIRKYLEMQDYQYIARIFCDDFFIKKGGTKKLADKYCV